MSKAFPDGECGKDYTADPSLQKVIKKTKRNKFVQDPSCQARMHQYQIVGRAAPTPKNPTPKIYRMRLFARSQVLAKSRFWYFMKKINKAKRSGGELLGVNELYDPKPLVVKNYAIWLRYESRTNTHNMYKEYRDVTINGAVGQMYSEMAGRHRSQPGAIQIIKTAVIPASACRRDHMKEMHNSSLKFPMVRRMPLDIKEKRKTFQPNRVNTYVK
uniref:Large ribosomal subunit protein eL20 domain-containing protein n=1 Tax=Noctiluca scintillans TaxID=2966 RepID=A0A7S1AC23_NOCSC|mmetsp:Transcript_39280/g.104243  ORF Transcript_39280/g.104243 Transcript_39280/m.104243 type:complete len:215 (+) Transcript_39280:53-697(+)